MTADKTLIIVQPYLPNYRLAFFSRLIDDLGESNVRVRVAAASPSGHQSARADAADADWLIPVHHRLFSIGGRTLTLGGAAGAWAGADGVIVGHLGSSVDTYRALLTSKLPSKRLRVGLWGHIDSYVAESHPVDAAAERWQLRRADHVFAYTPSGAAFASTAGVPADRITAVMNTVDTHKLQAASANLKEPVVAAFMANHGLKAGRTLGFFGGLDESKRISFLAAALDRLWETDPDLKLVVGGEGSQAHLLDMSISRGQTIRLGYALPHEQALIGRAASALLMPGRIGLVAVEALLLGIPILTTAWPYHSAEAEYLTEGESRHTSDDDINSYVAMVRRFMRVPANSDTVVQSSAWKYPTIDEMVANFKNGVLTMFD